METVSYTHLDVYKRQAPDKVTQKMTRDGAIAENLTTGETTSISERPPEENYSAPVAGAAEKTTQRISTCLLYTSHFDADRTPYHEQPPEAAEIREK